MSCDCYCSVAFPHGTVGNGLQCVIDVFSDHTHMHFSEDNRVSKM